MEENKKSFGVSLKEGVKKHWKKALIGTGLATLAVVILGVIKGKSEDGVEDYSTEEPAEEGIGSIEESNQ